MKIGILGDCHFTNHPPIRRLDDYWKTQKAKLKQALEIFQYSDCECIIQTGDLCDSPGMSIVVLSELIEILRSREVVLDLVFGNHCIWGHSSSTLQSSPLSVLKASGVVNILNEHGISPKNHPRVHIYGAGFGEENPKPLSCGNGDYNILVCHAPVGDVPLGTEFPLIHPVQFLKHNPQYDLIACGHYHYRFITSVGGRTILNPGALVRRTIAQRDLEHTPAVIIVDTLEDPDGGAMVKVVKLDVEPVERVFDTSATSKSSNVAINQFVDDIRDRRKIQSGVGWKQTLVDVMKDKNASVGAREAINSRLEKINGE